MPLTKKGEEIMANMVKQYGEKKGKEVFYASKNAGKITGVDTGDEEEEAMDECHCKDAKPPIIIEIRRKRRA